MEVEVLKININTEVDSNITINFIPRGKEMRDTHTKTQKLSMMSTINCIIMIVATIMKIMTCICNNSNNSSILHHQDKEKRLYILAVYPQEDYFLRMQVPSEELKVK